jgi:hypothetical protein
VCVEVQPLSSTVRPGQMASYAIWLWAAGRASSAAVVQIRAAQAFGVTGPRFSLCPSAASTSCPVGSLSVNQSDEVVAGVGVGSLAIGGERLVLTATVSAAGVASASASAVIDVITPTPGDPNGKLTPTALALGLAGGDFPPLLSLPGVTPVNPTALFPSVSPGSGSGAGSHRRPAGASRGRVEAAAVGAVAPMSTLIGGQVIGLAVLVGALAIAFVRIRRRNPAPAGGPDQPGRWSVRRLASSWPGWAHRWPGWARRWRPWARRT